MMKTPAFSYKKFRLSKINQPEFSHLKLLLGWIVYFLLYFLTENLIPIENCHVIHSKFDDLIPFCEGFLLPYVFWYGWIVFSLVYFLRYDVESFQKLQTYIIITQLVAMVVYILYPNCQNLRPEVFVRDNFFTKLIGMIYQFDTNTGVCPSLHCAYSIAIASVWVRRKESLGITKVFSVFAALMVCLSTMFIKQHSVLDFFAAIPVCVLAEILVFRVFYRK